MKRKTGFVLFLCAFLLCIAVNAEDVAINGDAFPDPVLCEAVRAFDINGDGSLSSEEAAEAEELSFTADTGLVSDFTGIETLPNLKILRNNGSGKGVELLKVDLSGNPELEEIDLYRNALASIDVSGNPKLRKLNVSNNGLTALDISGNPELEELSCYRNSLGELEVSGNPRLVRLVCSDNLLESLDVSGNPALRWLNCERNRISELVLPNDTLLSVLWCGSNSIPALDVSEIPLINRLLTNGTEADLRKDFWTGKENAYWAGNIETEEADETDSGAVYYASCSVDTDTSVRIWSGVYNIEKVRSFVANCYKMALDREASPTEVDQWAILIMVGEKKVSEAAKEFILSEECRNRGLDNEGKVKALYGVYFLREADEGGLAYWTGQLDSGAELGAVCDEFAGSEEFRNAEKAMR